MAPSYDVAADGRFLMIKPAEIQVGPVRREIIIVQNWQEELKQRVPTR